MKRVLLYLRKSRDDDNESKEETLARHERMLLDYCSRYDLSIEKIYREVVSGESIAARPEMQKLLEDVQSGDYHGVVVVELERLSRGNQIDQAEILEIFNKSKTKIYTLTKIYDFSSENDIDEEFFEFGLFMSRREYKVIKRRLLRGRKQAQKEGYFIGSITPLGFGKKKDGKGFVLYPDENAEKVITIFDMFVNQGRPLSEIRDYLIHSGLRPARATEWTSRRVRQILENQNYIGNIKVMGEWKEGKHDGIIPVDVFKAAQLKLQNDLPKVRKQYKIKNPLAGICKCAVCGHPLQLSSNKVSGQTPIKCRTTNCPTVSTYLEILEPMIIEGLQESLAGYRLELDDLPATAANRREAIEKEREIYIAELNKKQAMLDKASEMLEIGVYSVEKYLERESILRNEMNALQANLDALSDTSELDEIERLENAVPILEKCLDEYWTLNPAEKNEILKSFVDKILYSKSIKNNSHHKDLDDASVEIFLKI